MHFQNKKANLYILLGYEMITYSKDTLKSLCHRYSASSIALLASINMFLLVLSDNNVHEHHNKALYHI